MTTVNSRNSSADTTIEADEKTFVHAVAEKISEGPPTADPATETVSRLPRTSVRPVDIPGKDLEQSVNDIKIEHVEIATISESGDVQGLRVSRNLREPAQTTPAPDNIGAGDSETGTVGGSEFQMISNEVLVRLPSGSPSPDSPTNLHILQRLDIAGVKDLNDVESKESESPRRLAEEAQSNLPIKPWLESSPEPTQTTPELIDDVVAVEAEWTVAESRRKSKTSITVPITGTMAKEKARPNPAASVADPRFPISKDRTKDKDSGRIGKQGSLPSAGTVSSASVPDHPPANMPRRMVNASSATPSAFTRRTPTLMNLPIRRTGQSVHAAWDLGRFQPAPMTSEDWPTLRESTGLHRPGSGGRKGATASVNENSRSVVTSGGVKLDNERDR